MSNILYVDTGVDYGEAIYCGDCNKVLLVDIGSDYCFHCESEGSLDWVVNIKGSDFKPEMSYDYFKEACEKVGIKT